MPGDGTTARYRLERARWETNEPDCWEVTLDDAHHLRELRHTCTNRKGEKTVFDVTGIRLGEPIPESEFEVPTANVQVREVDNLNPVEVFGHLMQLGGSLLETAKTQRH